MCHTLVHFQNDPPESQKNPIPVMLIVDPVLNRQKMSGIESGSTSNVTKMVHHFKIVPTCVTNVT